MAKDLPYFKFFVSEWSDGDITLEDMETQGLFINLCSYYWSQECNVTLAKAKKRFKHNTKLIDTLLESDIISVDGDDVCIRFLNEQQEERLEQSKVRSKGGKASAEARRLTKLQQETNTSSTQIQHVLNSCSTESQLLREDKIREDKIRKEERREKAKKDFQSSLSKYLDTYGKTMLNNFYFYWTEHGENDYKLRFEKEKSFSIQRRLTTWSSREKTFTQPKQQARL